MEGFGAIVFLPREGGKDRPLLFEDILFTPAAVWLARDLAALGVTRFLVVCHADDRDTAAGLFPVGTEFVTTDAPDASALLSAFLSTQEGSVRVITKPVLLVPGDTRLFSGSGVSDFGVWTIPAADLNEELSRGKPFDAALRAKGAAAPEGPAYLLDADPERRYALEYTARQFSIRRLWDAGVRVLDALSVYVDPTVTVGAGTVLLPGTILRGTTTIGKNCEIGPNAMIRDCAIGDRVTVNASQLNESTVGDDTKVGPFAYVRPHCHVGKDVKVGDFVELKNSVIGDGTKISHLTYVGDSDVGGKVNFGCGTVTVNYDGSAKFRTAIGDGAFIGCNTNLVAPVRIGDGAYTAAGSTITADVPADSLAIARSAQVIKVQWAAKRRRSKGKK